MLTMRKKDGNDEAIGMRRFSTSHEMKMCWFHEQVLFEFLARLLFLDGKGYQNRFGGGGGRERENIKHNVYIYIYIY